MKSFNKPLYFRISKIGGFLRGKLSEAPQRIFIFHIIIMGVRAYSPLNARGYRGFCIKPPKEISTKKYLINKIFVNRNLEVLLFSWGCLSQHPQTPCDERGLLVPFRIPTMQILRKVIFKSSLNHYIRLAGGLPTQYPILR